VSGLTYRLTDHGTMFEYRMMIRTTDDANFTRLARSLASLQPVREFDLSPSSD
jgi:putative Mg2+ transporter-C (MgtC) family protein